MFSTLHRTAGKIRHSTQDRVFSPLKCQVDEVPGRVPLRPTSALLEKVYGLVTPRNGTASAKLFSHLLQDFIERRNILPAGYNPGENFIPVNHLTAGTIKTLSLK